MAQSPVQSFFPLRATRHIICNDIATFVAARRLLADGHAQRGAAVRVARYAGAESMPLDVVGWFQPATMLGLVMAFVWSRTLLGIPPRGRMPSLRGWLRRAPPRPKRLGLQKLGSESSEDMTAGIQLRPATSLSSIWEAYLFAGSFSDIPVALQLLEFPQAFLDWRRSDGLIPGLPNTPPAIDPIFSRKAVPGSEDEVVRACDEMLDSYGGVLLAVSESELVGTLAVRVKWLPQACHLGADGGNGKVAVRTVPYAQVQEAPGLEPVAYLEQFAVAPAWRGTGLAARLLGEAEIMARQWGLGLVTLHVQRDDWQPLRFYQKHGFEITSDWMGRGPQRFLLMKVVGNG
ncbi:unnamed protein product [Effrenium voratum]|uniref:N-acetyltransferase domain-containing protein n=1 Tax=Effrenium voratum TaxID=2562239 RepID=A0AA36N659_9DINO|nr:unnamed protein product [Effrenium voratum]